MDALARYFDFAGRNTTFSRELRGAIATFLTMAYILFANPGILANAGTPENPYDMASAIACTALAAGLCCILMGLWANFPIALASGMGLNAIVAFTVAKAAGSWQAAMGLIVLDGLVVLLLVLGGLREAVMRAIPHDLRLAIGAGIGLFIAFIGLQHAQFVVPDPATLVSFGTLRNPVAAVALIGLLITALLMARKVTGALVLGIVLTTAVALVWGAWVGNEHLLRGWPPKLHAPSFAVAFQVDLRGALRWDLMPLLFAIIMVDFFDTLGTATAIAEEGQLHDRDGRIPGLRPLLIVDSLSASIGGLLGVSSVTCYVESAAGVAEGARTGLHSVFVGLFFLLAVLLAPLAAIVPGAATAPALILVGFLMISQIIRIDFDNLETAIPAFLVLLAIPMTFSIAHGIGLGFISYVLIQLFAGKGRSVSLLMYIVAAAFAAYLVWGH